MVVTGGILSVLLGVFHLMFWKIFGWETELLKLSTTNSNILQILTIGCSFLLLAFGYMLIFMRRDIATTRTGSALLLTLALFYAIRLVLELVLPGGSIGFALVMVVFILVYLLPLFAGTSGAKRQTGAAHSRLVGSEI